MTGPIIIIIRVLGKALGAPCRDLGSFVRLVSPRSTGGCVDSSGRLIVVVIPILVASAIVAIELIVQRYSAIVGGICVVVETALGVPRCFNVSVPHVVVDWSHVALVPAV